jgi:predicted outer membrane repeat protein
LNLRSYSSKIAVGNNIGGIRSRTMRYVLTAILAISAAVCQARTIYVNASGTGDYPTIQAAVNDSNTGDIIILLPGTYTGVGNRNIDLNGKSITVQSTDPCDPVVMASTVIDCQGIGYGFKFVKGESPLLAGFTIINGRSSQYYDVYGGAIYSKSSSSTIFNCVIKKCGYFYGYNASEAIVCDYSSIKLLGCTISENGYAIDCFDSNAEITGCTISKNFHGISFVGSSYPPYGPPIISNTVKITDSIISDNNIAMGYSVTNLTIERSTISDNNMLGTSYTGIAGISAEYSNVVINDSIISRNRSLYYSSSTMQPDAGGVLSSNGTLDMNNCVISDNKAVYGGGITNYQGAATIRNCSITNNTAGGLSANSQYYDGKGGGIYSYSPTQLIIEGCTIKDNQTLGRPIYSYMTLGGGICSEGGSATSIKKSSIISNKARNGGGIYSISYMTDVNNCLLANNEAETGGGGYHGYRYINCTFVGNKAVSCAGLSGVAIVSNCIFWDDFFSSSEIGGGPTISYSDVRWATPDGSNISADPMFTFENDGHLLPGSPCIDAGTNTFPPANPPIELSATDLDGNPRIIDGDSDGIATVDMGAFEFNSAVSRLAISNTEFTFSCAKGGPNPNPQVLQIRNCNGKNLDWQIIENYPWLNVSPQSGTSLGHPSSVTIAIDANKLDIGTYQADMLVTSSGATGSPQTVHVTVNVGRLLSVPQNFNTIQKAIDEANNGDWVLVADGIYTGDGNRDIDFKGKAITVHSQNGPKTCIIDCNGTSTTPHRGFIFQTGETNSSILEGFTIANCYSDLGGAIYINHCAPTINNCIFSKNTASAYGGALWASVPYSNLGTAIDPIVIEQCSFIENSSIDYGGAIYSGWSLKLTDCNFTGNATYIYGDGIGGGIGLCFSSSSTSCSALIENCNFTGNFAAMIGGAINATSNTAGNISIMNSTFIGNTAGEGAGALSISTKFNTNMSNSVLAGNRAGMRGVFSLSGSPQITNCTIVGNSTISSDPLSGPLWGHSAVVRNCIIADYGPGILERSPDATVTFSNVKGGFPGVGNIDIDPCFVKPGYWADPNHPNIILEPNDLNAVWVNGDYHLKSEGWRWDIKRNRWTYDDVTSRCIDAGNPGSSLGDEPLSIPDDPDNEWGQNLRIDMGAYGGTAEASMAPYGWAILSDLTNDGIVDFKDFANLAENWQAKAEEQPGDLDRNGVVYMEDLWLFAEDWLLETSWHEN